MKHYPEELKYTPSHDWARLEEDDMVVIGITEHAQDKLGDIVHVDLPDVNEDIDSGDDVCVIESVKAAAEIYSPIAGTIVEVNDELGDAPGLINTDPFGDGWLYKIKVANKADYDELLSLDDYKEILEEPED